RRRRRGVDHRAVQCGAGRAGQSAEAVVRTTPREDRRPAAGSRRRRRGFGLTWWGEAWVTARAQGARRAPTRLPRARSYARGGTVGELTIAPGEVRAAVQGRRARPYQVRVRVRVLEAREWDRVLDAIAAQIGHAAALLDGELLPEVADDVRSAGTDLLPGPGELQPRCSCPDWADPCKHGAAVCYLVAGALDADPFSLLLLRGRRRDEVLAALRARRRSAKVTIAHPDRSGPAVDPGVDAREAYRRSLASLPEPPRRPHRQRPRAALAALAPSRSPRGREAGPCPPPAKPPGPAAPPGYWESDAVSARWPRRPP